MAYLTVEDLKIGYEKKTISEPVSFKVDKKDYLCIVGENGAGKTTLMKTLLGLLKPIGGKIKYGDGLKAKEIGYLPQQTLAQRDFPASVREVVLSGCLGRCGLRPFYNTEEKKLAVESMERMEILQFADQSYRNLSGGQQQRVLLARALCATQKILLLDEPVSGLDPKVTANMYELIKKLNDEGITVIMISHDIVTAMQYATHILHMGERVFYGTAEEYRESDEGKYFLKDR